MKSRLVAVATTLACLATVPAAWADCPDADLRVTPDNRAQVSAALVCIVNAERAKRDIPVAAPNEILAATAQHHADGIGSGEEEFDHDDKQGRSTDERAKARGYTGFAGENLAGGATAREAMDLLMGDAPHRDSLMAAGNDEIGAGAAPHRDFEGVVAIVVGDSRAGGSPGGGDQAGRMPPAGGDEGFAPRRTIFSLVPLQRLPGGRIHVVAVLRGVKVTKGARITLRLRRGSGALTRVVRVAPDGFISLALRPPAGRGRVKVSAAVTVAGRRLVRTRSL